MNFDRDLLFTSAGQNGTYSCQADWIAWGEARALQLIHPDIPRKILTPTGPIPVPDGCEQTWVNALLDLQKYGRSQAICQDIRSGKFVWMPYAPDVLTDACLARLQLRYVGCLFCFG